jgi:hypothetical protein
VAPGDAPAQRPALADEVLLPDELLETPWAHAGSQRLPLGRWPEQGLGSGALHTRLTGHRLSLRGGPGRSDVAITAELW